jgi:hypothetical protein
MRRELAAKKVHIFEGQSGIFGFNIEGNLVSYVIIAPL